MNIFSLATKGSNDAPTLSVCIVVLQGQHKLLRCLNALDKQEYTSWFEIAVPYDQQFAEISDMAEAFPAVRFLPVKGRRTYAEMRALAIRSTGGTIVAITEDHCIPANDWVTSILAAHESSHAAVGGAIEKTMPDTNLNWALYLADYVRYDNPRTAGLAHTLTDCNVSYKRKALNRISEVWQIEFHEPEVHGALTANGESLWYSPSIVVNQQRSMTLKQAVRDRYAFGRLFGGRRIEGTSMFQRILYALLALPLPLLLTLRVARIVFPRRPYLSAFLKALPYLLLLNACWAWGEFVGYLTGASADSLTPVHPIGEGALSASKELDD